jgi:hypothetical protein
VTGVSSNSWVFSCRYHSTVAVHTQDIIWGMNNRAVGGRSSDLVSPHRHEERTSTLHSARRVCLCSSQDNLNTQLLFP